MTASIKVNHATVLYDYLQAQANEQRDWSGSLLSAALDCGLTTGQYNRAIKLLEGSGCIQIFVRGSRTGPTELTLLKHPSEAELHLTPRPADAKILLEIETLKRQTGGINLVAALADVEARLTRLEAKIANYERR